MEYQFCGISLFSLVYFRVSAPPPLFCYAEDVDDDRLAIVKDLLRSEDTYLENLRNIFDIYMDPLK